MMEYFFEIPALASSFKLPIQHRVENHQKLEKQVINLYRYDPDRIQAEITKANVRIF